MVQIVSNRCLANPYNDRPVIGAGLGTASSKEMTMTSLKNRMCALAIVISSLIGTAFANDSSYDYSESLRKIRDPFLRQRIENLNDPERKFVEKYGIDGLILIQSADPHKKRWLNFALKEMQIDRVNDRKLHGNTIFRELVRDKSHAILTGKMERDDDPAKLKSEFVQSEAFEYESRRQSQGDQELSTVASGKPWYSWMTEVPIWGWLIGGIFAAVVAIGVNEQVRHRPIDWSNVHYSSAPKIDFSGIEVRDREYV
jgi:hypothetical protein